MNVGWIKLHRLLLEKEIFQDAHVLKVFIYLLLKASYKEMKLKVGNKNIELMPGQLLYGRRVVSQKLNMGEGKLRNIMNYLVQSGSIEVESHSKFSIVTIANWEQYQRGDSEPDFPFDVDFFGDDEEDEVIDNEASEVYESESRAELVVKEKAKPKSTIDPYEISWDGYKDWREESYGEEFWNKVWGKETIKTEPAENQMQMQSGTGFQNYDDDFSAISEPQYNNINKYKNNKINNNKTRENNKTTKQNKNTQNTQNTENISYRQSESIINDCNMAERVAGQSTSQEMLLSDGDGVSKGNVSFLDSANSSDTDSQAEAFTALSAMNDAALDAYFASCSFADSFEPIPLDDSDMPVVYDDCRRPGHDFTAEMVYSLTQQDIEQLDAMFRKQSVAAVGYPHYKNKTEKSRLSQNNADKKQDRPMNNIKSCPA